MVDDLAHIVATQPVWYHTIDLAPGVTTPGWFDLRPIVERMPWPDVKGKRCLDVGTYDGFLAFELERRGASEVVAVDIDDHTLWDWPPDVRAQGAEELARLAGPEKSLGFNIAATALGSKVDRRPISVYDLSPELVGMFDVVVCGSLMLHLRDPLRALEAIRTVTGGVFLSAEQISFPLTLKNRHTPLLELNGSGPLCQWCVPNAAGHHRMIYAAGFKIEKSARPYAIPFGTAHPPVAGSLKARAVLRILEARLGNKGVAHSAVLARPRV